MQPRFLAGLALLLAGCSLTGQSTSSAQVLHYQCGTMPLTVTLDNPQQVRFILDGKALTLQQTVSASGARYSDGQYVFWSKGNSAFIERNDKIIVNDCQQTDSGQQQG